MTRHLAIEKLYSFHIVEQAFLVLQVVCHYVKTSKMVVNNFLSKMFADSL
jgi:hypothetical protein